MAPHSMRIARFAVALALFILPIGSSLQGEDLSWPMFRGNLERTGTGEIQGSMLEPDIKWKFSYPGKTEGGKIHSSPAAADINGDGSLEIILGLYLNESSGAVIAISSNGNMLWEYRTAFSIVSSPAIADIDWDGSPDILIGLGGDEPTFKGSGGVLALESDGTPKWMYEISGVVRSSPAVADILPDIPGLEIAVGAGALGDESAQGSGAQGLHVIDSNRNLVWKYGITNWEVESSPAVVDIDGDGLLEVVFGTDTHLMVALRNDGSILWEHSIGEGYWDITSTPAVIDAIGSIPGAEIFFGAYDGKFRMLGADGREIWAYAAGSPIHSSASVADADGDGHPEVVFGGGNSRCVYMLSAENGTLLWKYYAKNAVYSSPVLADVDGDGKLETIIGSDDATLYAINSDGTLLWKCEVQGGIYSSPAICDIDGDGGMDIIFADDSMSIYGASSDVDLALTKLSFSSSKNSAGAISVDAKVIISNLGGTKSPKSAVRLSYGGIVLSEEVLPPIHAGATLSFSRSFTIEYEGSAALAAFVDPADAISESNEQNNFAQKSIAPSGGFTAGAVIPPLIIGVAAIGAVFRKRTFVGSDFLKTQKKVKRYCPMFSTVEDIYEASKYNPKVWSWLYSGCLRVVKPHPKAYEMAGKIRSAGRDGKRMLSCCAAMETGMNTIAFSEDDAESAAVSRIFGLGVVK